MSDLRLNTLSPADGSKPVARRVGRGIGSGFGKTAGRGHKGQKSRSGGYHKVGFEGGQMPIYRRLPKVGFSSRVGRVTEEVRLSELAKVEGDVVSIETLRSAGIIKASTLHAKVFLSGEVTKAVTIEGLRVTKGAKEAIEKAGGKIVEAKTDAK